MYLILRRAKDLRTFILLIEKKERKRGLMWEWLKDLLRIYTWKELWMVVSVPTAVMGVWLLFCLLISIPIIIIRAIAIWSLVFILTLGSATIDALRKKQANRGS